MRLKVFYIIPVLTLCLIIGNVFSPNSASAMKNQNDRQSIICNFMETDTYEIITILFKKWSKKQLFFTKIKAIFLKGHPEVNDPKVTFVCIDKSTGKISAHDADGTLHSEETAIRLWNMYKRSDSESNIRFKIIDNQ